MGDVRRPRGLVGISAAAVVLFVAAALLGSSVLGPSGTAVPSGAGIDLSPRVAPRSAGGDAARIADIPAGSRAVALVDLAAHAIPGGPARPLLDGATPIEHDQDLVVLGEPVAIDSVPWLRVLVLPRINGGPADSFTWIPATSSGRDTIRRREPLGCPPTRDNLSTIAALDPFTRARCLGAAAFTVEGRTWSAALPVSYDIEPSWLGAWGRGTGSFSLKGQAGASVEVRVPPGLEPPPLDITVRAEVHLADPAAATCTRSTADQDVPVEAGADSRLWCTVQLVADRWEPVLGPEGQPFDPKTPQLHRSEPFSVCAGINMGSLTFRTDPNRLDPVWLEAIDGGQPILAWFGPEFHVAFTPDLVVVDDAGRVVARDGLTVDPDIDLAGHTLCPTGGGLHIN